MRGLSLVRRAMHRAGVDISRHPRWNTVEWALHHALPRLGVDCVLDVGAHHGEFGQILRSIGFRGDILSFEPALESYARASAEAAADPRWHVHRFGLGAADGELTLNVAADGVFNSFLPVSADAPAIFRSESAVRSQEIVPVRRLDTLLDEMLPDHRTRTIFLKCDTQGFDFQVLEGAGSRLRHFAGVLIEVPVQKMYEGMPTLDETLRRARELGFRVSGLFPVTHDERLRVTEFDCLLEPET